MNNKIGAHLKKCSAAYLVGILFFYCFMCMPLHYDQLVSVGLYTKFGGILNYTTGYCWYWVTHVNGRLLSTFFGGFLEQNYTLMFVTDSIMLALFPVLCAHTFAKTDRNQARIMWVTGLFLLLLSRGIEIEVLGYALFIYFAPTLMVLYLIRRLDAIMPTAEQRVTTKAGWMYLGIVLILSLWMENITAGMVVVSGCLLLWDFFVNKRKNYWLLGGTALAAACMLLMARYRAGAVEIGRADMLHQITNKARLVCDTCFRDNAAITVLFTLIAFAALQKPLKAAKGWRKICGRMLQTFWGYHILIHSIAFYNDTVAWAKSMPVPAAGGSVTTLPEISVSLLLPPENGVVRLLLYLLLALSFAVPILLSANRLALLVAYGFSMATMDVIFLTGENFGPRVISPSLFVLCIAMVGVLAEVLSKQEASSPWLKGAEILVIVIFLFRCDYYYNRYTQIGWKNAYNEKAIGYAVERQMCGEWDYDTDTLQLEIFWDNTELFGENITNGYPHFPFFCRYYGLDERTRVLYVYD